MVGVKVIKAAMLEKHQETADWGKDDDVEVFHVGLDPCGVCSSIQVNNGEAEHLSSEGPHSRTAQPTRTC